MFGHDFRMKKGLFILGFLWMLQLLVAQERMDFQEGYVVLANNDTVYGALKKHPYPNLNSTVSFKERNSAIEKAYTTEEIKSFHFEPDLTFEAIRIRLIYRKDTTERMYFALRKLTGRVDLFVLYLPIEKERYFVRNTEFGLAELKQPIETIQDKVYSNRRYLTTLAKYLKDVPDLQSKIQTCNYYENAFVRLISEYNGNFGSAIRVEPKSTLNCDLFVISGLDYFLGEKIITDIDVFGQTTGLEASFYNKAKSMKSEIVVGFHYQTFVCSSNYFSYNLKDSIQVNSPYMENSHLFYVQGESTRISQTGHVVGLPMYLKYNNRLKMISPLVEGGVEPFLIQTSIKVGNDRPYQSKFKYGFRYILGLGVGLNRSRFRIKYMVYAEPLLQTSLSIQYKI